MLMMPSFYQKYMYFDKEAGYMKLKPNAPKKIREQYEQSMQTRDVIFSEMEKANKSKRNLQ